MFGPVSRQSRRPGDRSQSLGTKAGPRARAQRGLHHRVARRRRRRNRRGRSCSGRHQRPSAASSAAAACTSSSAIAAAAAAMAGAGMPGTAGAGAARPARSRLPACSPASATRRSSSASAAQVKRMAFAMVWRWIGACGPSFGGLAQQRLAGGGGDFGQEAELLVVADLQAGDAPGLREVHLQRGDRLARAVAQAPQRIEFAVIAGGDEAAIVQPRRQRVGQGAQQFGARAVGRDAARRCAAASSGGIGGTPARRRAPPPCASARASPSRMAPRSRGAKRSSDSRASARAMSGAPFSAARSAPRTRIGGAQEVHRVVPRGDRRAPRPAGEASRAASSRAPAGGHGAVHRGRAANAARSPRSLRRISRLRRVAASICSSAAPAGGHRRRQPRQRAGLGQPHIVHRHGGGGDFLRARRCRSRRAWRRRRPRSRGAAPSRGGSTWAMRSASGARHGRAREGFRGQDLGRFQPRDQRAAGRPRPGVRCRRRRS